MFKAIFWDNDGVLVDTEHLYFDATQQVLGQVEVTLTEEMYREHFLRRSSGVRSILAEHGLTEERIQDLRSRRNKLYISLLSSQDLVLEGVRDTLNILHNRFQMAIVTSSDPTHFNLIHEKSDLLRFFDFLVTPENYKKSKPDPEPYLRAVEISGCAASECLVIEDSLRGLLAAKAAGLNCWIIPSRLTMAQDFSAADKVLRNVSEIVNSLDLDCSPATEQDFKTDC